MHGTLMGRWVAYILSRGFYLILVSLIFFCIAVAAVRKKLEAFGILAAEKKKLSIEGSKRNDNNENFDTVKKELEETIIKKRNLQATLEDVQQTVKSLTTSIDEAEISKNHSEDEILMTQLDFDLEIENLRKENETMLSLLHRTRTENEALKGEIEELNREARISEAVIKDKDNLNERLKTARAELDELKFQLKGIQIERDTAVRLAAEHIQQVTSELSPQKIEVIEEMIDAELKRVREEEEIEQESRCPTIAEEDYLYATISRSRGSDRSSQRTVIGTKNDASGPRRQEGRECGQATGDAPACCTCQDDSDQPTDRSLR